MKKNDFGYEQLTKTEHYKKVQNVFDSVAKEYDLMNDIMSLGLHRIWKKDFVNLIDIDNKKKQPHHAWPLRTNQDNVGADLHGEDLFGSTATARRAKE